jgi:hypothetical protein
VSGYREDVAPRERAVFWVLAATFVIWGFVVCIGYSLGDCFDQTTCRTKDTAARTAFVLLFIVPLASGLVARRRLTYGIAALLVGALAIFFAPPLMGKLVS